MRSGVSNAGNAVRSTRVGGPAREGAPRLIGDGGSEWRPSSRAGRRVQRRRRFAGLLRFAVFLLLVFLAAWAGVRVAYAGIDAAVEGERYVASAGDTLWQVALEHYGDDVDPRRAVYEIRVANSFAPSRVLQPGDELVLPRAANWGAAAFTGE